MPSPPTAPSTVTSPTLVSDQRYPLAVVEARIRRPEDRSHEGLVAAEDTTPDLDLITNWESYVNPDVAIAPRTVNYVTSVGVQPRYGRIEQ